MSIEYDALTAEAVTTTRWRPEAGVIPEPFRPDYCPWEPTPGKIYHPEIADHQSDIGTQASEMLEANHRPPFVSDKLAEFVELVYWSREANRSAENTNSYSRPLHELTKDDLELEENLQKAELGTASPQEVLELISKLGMGSAELARLTHIYGYRIEYLEAMRQHIKRSIIDSDGEVFENPEAAFNIVTLDTSVTLKGNLSFGIAMKRKRKIGHVDGIDVYERTTFILRLDNGSHINPIVARYLKSLPLYGARDDKKQMLQNGLLEKEVLRLLEADDLESLIPMSTTIYACSDENRRAIAAEEERRKAADSELIFNSNPECHADLIRHGFGLTATKSLKDFEA